MRIVVATLQIDHHIEGAVLERNVLGVTIGVGKFVGAEVSRIRSSDRRFRQVHSGQLRPIRHPGEEVQTPADSTADLENPLSVVIGEFGRNLSQRVVVQRLRETVGAEPGEPGDALLDLLVQLGVVVSPVPHLDQLPGAGEQVVHGGDHTLRLGGLRATVIGSGVLHDQPVDYLGHPVHVLQTVRGWIRCDHGSSLPWLSGNWREISSSNVRRSNIAPR